MQGFQFCTPFLPILRHLGEGIEGTHVCMVSNLKHSSIQSTSNVHLSMALERNFKHHFCRDPYLVEMSCGDFTGMYEGISA